MWQLVRGVAAEPLPQPAADVRVRLAGLRRRGVAAGADRPDRLVGDHERGDLVAGQAVEARPDLPVEHRRASRSPSRSVERLADADDRRELGGDARRAACG